MAELMRALGGEEANGTDARTAGLRPRRVVQVGMLDRLQSRFEREVTIFTGLSPLTMPLLKRLAETAPSPHSIVVIEPAQANPLLDEARSLGARVVIGSPTSSDLLQTIIPTWRGCALRHLYALRSRAAENERVIAETARVLARYQPDPDCQPRLVALVDDPRQADHWRCGHIGMPGGWFEDALSPAETTARTVVARVLRARPAHLLVCGDSTFTQAILLELARRAWEHTQLMTAAAAGSSAESDLTSVPDAASLLPPRVDLFDPRSPDIRREYLASAPAAVPDLLPSLVAHQVHWRDHVLRILDAMDPAQAQETVVIITEEPPGSGLHEAGRIALLHPETPVFVLADSDSFTVGEILGLLNQFEPGLLVEGEVPENTWERVARLWHECYRLSHPLPPGDPEAAARLPWAELDPYVKQDSILRLRSVMAAVAALGRHWVPVHQAPEGSLIELSAKDLIAVTDTVHTRWYVRQLAAGREGKVVAPWAKLPASVRAELCRNLYGQLTQLQEVGFVAIIPKGGPPVACPVERVGVVRASQLSEPLAWSTHAGEQMHGLPGDWRLVDAAGNVRMVADSEFRSSHQPLGGDRWRRVGAYRAWQVTEAVVVGTKEGKATALPGDWVVEAPTGERWPVGDRAFYQNYRPVPDRLDPVLDQASAAPPISS
jgi:hypothetical protein